MRKDERNVFPEDTNYKNTEEKEMLKKQKRDETGLATGGGRGELPV